MAAIRCLVVLLAVIFVVQLASAGVQRRDTAAAGAGAAAGSDHAAGISGLLDSLNQVASTLRAELQGFANNHNATTAFNDVSAHVDSLRTMLAELGGNFTQHFAPTTAPAH